MTWSAAQYTAFEDERTRPVRDLLAGVPALEARSAVDLGCGPGNSTQVLAGRFPNARIAGIDSSQDMIAAARKRLPAVDFEVAEIDAWIKASAGQRFDVVLANAVLQWVPDHASLFPALSSRLAAGGGLAVALAGQTR